MPLSWQQARITQPRKHQVYISRDETAVGIMPLLFEAMPTRKGNKLLPICALTASFIGSKPFTATMQKKQSNPLNRSSYCQTPLKTVLLTFCINWLEKYNCKNMPCKSFHMVLLRN